MDETRVLAEFVDATEYTDLPASLVDDLKIIVLDTFAAAFIGTAQPWARMVIEMVRELGGTPEATIINHTWQTDISRAALANGALIGAFECEPLTGSHASGTVLPAVLAVCDSEGLDGQAFLTALALGFEAGQPVLVQRHVAPCRIGQAGGEEHAVALARLVHIEASGLRGEHPLGILHKGFVVRSAAKGEDELDAGLVCQLARQAAHARSRRAGEQDDEHDELRVAPHGRNLPVRFNANARALRCANWRSPRWTLPDSRGRALEPIRHSLLLNR